MKKIFILIGLFFLLQAGFSQVGINTTSPDAQLHIKSSNQATPANTDGVLIPKIDAFPVTNPTAAQQGMMVYLNTLSAGKPPGFYYWDNTGTPQWKAVGGNAAIPNGTAIGNTMYWNGTTWVNNSSFLYNDGTSVGVNTTTPSSLLTVKKDAVGFTQESASGNSKIGFYTNNGGAWLQTHSDTDLSFATSDGATQMVLKKTTGNLGINTLSPSEKLEVAGKTKTTDLQVTNGAGVGKVLTSDVNGNATWQTATGANGWSLTGNAGTDPTVNFIGTTDDKDVVFHRDFVEAGRLGMYDTSFGRGSLRYNTGVRNTAIGNAAMGGLITGFNSGDFNTAVGSSALSHNTTGSSNSSFGSQSLISNTKGSSNAAFGDRSLVNNTNASKNVALGPTALFMQSFDNADTPFDTNNVAVGVESLYNNNPTAVTNGINNTAVGNYSLKANTTGINNTAIGTSSLSKNTTGEGNTAVGYQSLLNTSYGFYNTATGGNALYSNASANFNTAHGYAALYANTEGSNNTANGYNSLTANFSGRSNTANGDASLRFNTTGSYNTAIGSEAFFTNVTGSYATVVGARAMYYANDIVSATPFTNTNVAIGYEALRGSTTPANNTGTSNTAVGYQSLRIITSGSRNVGLGWNTLSGITTGNYNTAVGSNTYVGVNFSNSAAIGDAATVTAGNQVRLGDGTVSSIGGFANWTNVSDSRLKKDIQQNVPGLAFITKLKPVTYYLDMDAIANLMKTPEENRKKESETEKGKLLQTGFIAQQVEQAANELNYDFSAVDKPKNENDFYGLRYAEFVVPLVKAVQEQQEIIETQNKKIQMLEEINTEIMKRLEKIENK